jgi:hypothetical protein
MTEKNCENCGKPAWVYAMGQYAGDWGDWYCLSHVPSGFMITDTITPRTKEITK